MTRATLDSLVLACLVARWAHLLLVVRPRREGQPRSEWQVWGLGAAYAASLVIWANAAVAEAPVSRGAAAAAGFAIVSGSVLRVLGQRALGGAFSWGSGCRGETLVTSGVYRYVRHPLLLGYALEVAALLLGGRAPTPLKGGVAALLVFSALAQVAREERALALRFGRQWRDYRRGTVV